MLTSIQNFLSTRTPDTTGSKNCQTPTEYKDSSFLWKIFKAVVDPSPIALGAATGFIVSEFSSQIANIGSPVSGVLAGIGSFSLVAGFEMCKKEIYEKQKELSLLAKTVIHLGAISALSQVIPSSIEKPGMNLVNATASKIFTLMRETPFLNRFVTISEKTTEATLLLADPLAATVSTILSNITPFEVDAGPVALTTALGISYLGYQWISLRSEEIKDLPFLKPIIKTLSAIELQTQILLKGAPILLTCYLNNQTFVRLSENPIGPQMSIYGATFAASAAHILWNLKYPKLKKEEPITVALAIKGADLLFKKAETLHNELLTEFSTSERETEIAIGEYETYHYITLEAEASITDVTDKSASIRKKTKSIGDIVHQIQDLSTKASNNLTTLKKQKTDKAILDQAILQEKRIRDLYLEMQSFYYSAQELNRKRKDSNRLLKTHIQSLDIKKLNGDE